MPIGVGPANMRPFILSCCDADVKSGMKVADPHVQMLIDSRFGSRSFAAHVLAREFFKMLVVQFELDCTQNDIDSLQNDVMARYDIDNVVLADRDMCRPKVL